MLNIAVQITPSNYRWGRAPPALCSREEIAGEIARKYGLTLGDIKGRDNRQYVSRARQEVMAALYATGRHSLPMIGRWIGRDHTTVLYGIRKHRMRSGL